jgi:hypothetical protein
LYLKNNYQCLSNDIFSRKVVKRFKKFKNVKIGFGNVICGLSRYLNIKESYLFIDFITLWNLLEHNTPPFGFGVVRN